ncbi:efflux transporter, RND family, MFP subunit [Desulfovibrio sp. X2]|uniref:efflux RND transporter periplasmic adaptor subunit n=1 Tax=Desulfovibrio sp. X2 TaxID=941449 RepID=UPI0003587915|nr:efflux RND transporter periplasmic adaptor subunit [Desulfovibrio sp. X2]EPR41220.1 efflux transporter, RND family, MFP subunit [Desulfovibrio sp. X2]
MQQTGDTSARDLSALRIDKSKATIRRSGRWKRRAVIIGVLAALLAGLWLAGVFTPSASVRVAVAAPYYPSQSFTLLNASGYVVAQRKAAVGSKITSRLVELYVEEGDRVKAGQIIARLEGADVQSALERARADVRAAQFLIDEAEARLYNTRRAYLRMEKLLPGGYVAQSDVDAAKSSFDADEAAVRTAKAQLQSARKAELEAKVNVDYTEIRAPFDAVVLTKDADVGDIVTPLGAAANAKASVVTIADMSSLQVEADVSESNISQVRTGQPCVVQLDALPGERFDGHVHMIVPTADRSKASVMVKVAFDHLDPRILPEMSAKAAFLAHPIPPDEAKAVLAVPTSALLPHKEGAPADTASLFLAEQGKARLTSVTTGRAFGDLTEIVSGLTNGQRVIVAPPEGLSDGAKIKVSE